MVLQGVFPREIKTCLRKNLYMITHIRFICSIQMQEINETSCFRQTVRQTVVYPYPGILLLSNKKNKLTIHATIKMIFRSSCPRVKTNLKRLTI